jgi:hypothetical protein
MYIVSGKSITAFMALTGRPDFFHWSVSLNAEEVAQIFVKLFSTVKVMYYL